MSGAATTSANANGWYNSSVTVNFTCSDATSGVPSSGCANPVTLSTEGASQSATAASAPVDNAGNTGTAATVTGISIDNTKPTVSFAGGPAAGSSHVFGSVPAAPTCSASDDLSGLNGSCTVTGYGTAVGTHTVTATATDRAGNTETAALTYTVLPWTLSGFYSPVDMNGVVNTVKAGLVVPLKFEVFAGPAGTAEKTTTDAIAVGGFKVTTSTACSSSSAFDEIEELVSAGSTSLRYDATAGQFIQNWQTPKTVGCFKVEMKAADGVTTKSAIFKTR
jgi:hypothetical protein